MPGHSARLRRAKSLLAYWEADRVVFHNFAKQVTFSANPITWQVLEFFSNWRTNRDAVAHFSNFSRRSVGTSVLQLVNHGLLVAEGSKEADYDLQITKKWSPWLPEASFHFATKDTPYVRDNWNLERLKASLPKTPRPKIFKSVKGTKRIRLPAKIFPSSEFVRVLMTRRTHRRFANRDLPLQIVSQLLSLVWGATGYVHSPLFGKLLHKTSPSGGARHPGEVYLMALRVKGLNPGLYHYHPGRHDLTIVNKKATPVKAWQYCAHQGHVRKANALFLMTAVFPRTMWKYQHPRAYRVVLLDTGHLCQTFCLVATWLGLAPFCTAALKDTLVERDLGIDGVSESILYVAGVGLPAKPAAIKNPLN